MFTRQIQNLRKVLQDHLPAPVVKAFEDMLGGCDQILEHRGPVQVNIDGDDRVGGFLDRQTLPQVCFANGEPVAAVSAANPSGYFSSDTCLTDCVTGGLAFRAIGPSAMDDTRIINLYVGAIFDLCGNPLSVGGGSEPVRIKIVDAQPDAGQPQFAIAKLMT